MRREEMSDEQRERHDEQTQRLCEVVDMAVDALKSHRRGDHLGSQAYLSGLRAMLERQRS